MKRFFKTVVLIALPMLLGISCSRELLDANMEPDYSSVRNVTFTGQAVPTKTGLSLMIVPDWRDTKNENIHLFEEFNGEVLEGTDPQITTGVDGNYKEADFTATFSEEISIIVTPPSNDPATKADLPQYHYTSIVAQKADGKYFVPAVQYPDEDTWIDPDADFLVADGVTSSESLSGKIVELDFVRPVSISRFAMTGLSGQVVKSITLTAESGLTGTASFEDVDFSNGTVNFDTTNSSSIELRYGDGRAASSFFYGYFISLAGKVNLVSLEVVTDQFIYTKQYNGNTSLTFKVNTFKNIAVDMRDADRVPVGEQPSVDQELSFFKNNGTITADSYDLYSTADYVTPELRGVATGATVSYSVNPAGVATVSETGVVTPVAVGEAVITATASAVEGYNETSISYTLTVTDSTPSSVSTYKKVTKALADWSGTYLFVKESANVAFAYNQNNYKVAVTIADGEIKSSDLAAYELTVSASTAGAGRYDITVSDGRYLYKYGNSEILFSTNISNNNQYYGEFSLSGNGDVTLDSHRTGGPDNYFQYSSNAFGYGTSSSATFQMYRLDDGTTPVAQKADRNLDFAEATVEKTVGDEPFTNALSGEKTDDVTYVSSDETVATVSAAGLVTVVGAGSATITASAIETDEYKAGSASFELTVNAAPEPSTTKTFTKVTAFTSGKNYVIVSGSNALKNNNGTDELFSVSGMVSGNTLTLSSEDAASLMWTAERNTSHTTQGDYTLKNGGYYLIRQNTSTSDNDVVLSNGAISTYFVWTLDGSNLHQKNSSGQYTFYLYITSNHWSANTQTAQNNISVYEESGSAPVVEKAERNLAFAQDNVQKKVNDPNFTVALSGAKTDDVVYSSDNEAVATVNPTTGSVNIQAAGTATITASADETSEFKSGSAQFSLTVSKIERSAFAFTNATVSVNLGESVPANNLVGDTEGDKTYASSKPEVATVNNSGVVTLVAAGSTEITVTVAETAKYLQATATYTLNVTDPNPPTSMSFTKVTAFTSGKSYVIVAGDNALKNNNGTDELFSVSGKVSGNTLTLSAEDAASLMWTAERNTSHTTQGDYTLKNGSYYLIRQNTSTSDNDVVLSNGAISTYFVWTLDGSNLHQKNSSGQYTFYLYITSNHWSANTQTAQNNISVYEYTGSSSEPVPDVKYYTKVNSLPGTNSWEKVLFVYDNGDGTGYAFKGIYSGNVSSTPSGGTNSNSSYLTTEGNAVPVIITSNGIPSSADVDACTLSMVYTDSTSKYIVQMDNNGGYFRMLAEGSNNGRFVCMSTGGYRLTYTVSGTGANNFQGKRESYYFGFNGTNFAGSTSSSYRFSIYKLAE